MNILTEENVRGVKFIRSIKHPERGVFLLGELQYDLIECGWTYPISNRKGPHEHMFIVPDDFSKWEIIDYNKHERKVLSHVFVDEVSDMPKDLSYIEERTTIADMAGPPSHVFHTIPGFESRKSEAHMDYSHLEQITLAQITNTQPEWLEGKYPWTTSRYHKNPVKQEETMQQGRPNVGDVCLPKLTVKTADRNALEARALDLGISEPEARRRALQQYLKSTTDTEILDESLALDQRRHSLTVTRAKYDGVFPELCRVVDAEIARIETRLQELKLGWERANPKEGEE